MTHLSQGGASIDQMTATDIRLNDYGLTPQATEPATLCTRVGDRTDIPCVIVNNPDFHTISAGSENAYRPLQDSHGASHRARWQ